MTNRRIALAPILLLALALPLAAQQKIQLKIASPSPSRSPWDIEQRALAQEWSKITNGLVSVTFYDTHSLGGEKGVLQKFRSVRPGQKAPLDGAIFSTIGLSELAPNAHIYTLSMPFLIRSQEELDLVLAQYGSRFTDPIKAAGFELITWTNIGWLSFYTKEPFRTLPELKRIKIASAGLDSPVLGDSFTAAGFTIENIPASKLLQEIKGNTSIRGFYAVHLFSYVTGLSKSVSHALDTKLCPVMAGLVISRESWDRIPAEYKPAMIAAVERMRVRLNASLDESDRQYVAKMSAEGVKMVRPTGAELTAWETEFTRDIDAISRAAPGAFDLDLYRKIQALLKSKRS